MAHGSGMAVQWQRHGSATAGPRQCHDSAVAVPSCIAAYRKLRLMRLHGTLSKVMRPPLMIAMAVPWQCHGSGLAVPSCCTACLKLKGMWLRGNLNQVLRPPPSLDTGPNYFSAHPQKGPEAMSTDTLAKSLLKGWLGHIRLSQSFDPPPPTALPHLRRESPLPHQHQQQQLHFISEVAESTAALAGLGSILSADAAASCSG